MTTPNETSGDIISPYPFHLATAINTINIETNDAGITYSPNTTTANFVRRISNTTPSTSIIIKSIAIYLAKLLVIIPPHNLGKSRYE